MINRKDVDAAWEKFQKTSVKGMLDTMAAQLNEISTNTERAAQIVPKVMGDEGAISQDPAMMGGAPPQLGGIDPSMMGGAPPDMGGAPPDMGGAPPDMGGAPPAPTGDIAPDELGAGVPPEGGNGDIEKLLSDYENGDMMTDEDLNAEPGLEDESALGNELGGADVPPDDMGAAPEAAGGDEVDALLSADIGDNEDIGGTDLSEEGGIDGIPSGAGEEADVEGLDFSYEDEGEGVDAPSMDPGEAGIDSEPMGDSDLSEDIDGTFETEETEEPIGEELSGGDVGSAKEMTGAPTADLDNSEVNAAYSNLIEKLKASVVSAIDAKDYNSIAGITDTISALDHAWDHTIEPSLKKIAKSVAEKKRRDEAVAKSVADTNAIPSDADPVTATAGGAPIDKNNELMSSDSSAPVEASDDSDPECASPGNISANADNEASPTMKSERKIEPFRDMFAKSVVERSVEIPDYEAESFHKTHEFQDMRSMMKESIAKTHGPRSHKNEPSEEVEAGADPLAATRKEVYGRDDEPTPDQLREMTPKEAKAEKEKSNTAWDDVMDTRTAKEKKKQKKFDDSIDAGNISAHLGLGKDEEIYAISHKDGSTTYEARNTPRRHKLAKSDEVSKHIATLDEKKNLQKSNASPDRASTTNAELSRPSLESIGKSVRDTSPVIKMGVGVDPHKVVESDWAEYKAFMKSRGI